jgi:hypothetical protein
LAELIVKKVGSTPAPDPNDPSYRIIELATEDPLGAYNELRDAIELELRRLLALTGWADGGWDVSVAVGLAELIVAGYLGRARSRTNSAPPSMPVWGSFGP